MVKLTCVTEAAAAAALGLRGRLWVHVAVLLLLLLLLLGSIRGTAVTLAVCVSRGPPSFILRQRRQPQEIRAGQLTK